MNRSNWMKNLWLAALLGGWSVCLPAPATATEAGDDDSVLLVQADPKSYVDIIAIIIIGREITVSALREWMATVGARSKVSVSWLGKLKTTLQMFGIAFMLHREPLLGINLYDTGFYLLVVAAALTLWSMWDYLIAAWPSMRAEDDEGN